MAHWSLASPSPQRLRLLKPKLIRMMAAAASTTPAYRSSHPGARSGFRRKLRTKTIAETAIRMPNAGRHPMNVPSKPPIMNANTPGSRLALSPARPPPSPAGVRCSFRRSAPPATGQSPPQTLRDRPGAVIMTVRVGLNRHQHLRAPQHAAPHAEHARRTIALGELRAEHDESCDQHRIRHDPGGNRSRRYPKLCTIPPSATGNEATLKDMIIWPRAMAIIGTHDSLLLFRMNGREAVVMACVPPG